MLPQPRNTDTTGGRLPDHFLFLRRRVDTVTLQQPGIEKMFAPTKQNGIIMRWPPTTAVTHSEFSA